MRCLSIHRYRRDSKKNTNPYLIATHQEARAIPNKRATIASMLPSCLLSLSLLLFLSRCTGFVFQPTIHSRRAFIPQQFLSLGLSERPFQHSDITWKLELPPETSEKDVRETKQTARLIKEQFESKGEPVPAVLVPQTAPSGQVVLEAYSEGGTEDKVGRFGFTTQPGPPLPLSEETLAALIKDERFKEVTALKSAALIYMWVDPKVRKRGLADLALQIIRFIHAAQGSDLTVLVADDDGSGKLVEFYEKRGFVRTPELQEILGSPNEQFGVAMIGPTNRNWPEDAKVQWW